MKPVEESISFFGSLELGIKRVQVPGFVYPWHRHPEYELTWIVRGSGRRFIGEHVADFGPGDIVLVGSGVPHVWLSESEANNSEEECEAVVIHFGADFPGPDLRKKNELTRVCDLLLLSARGVAFEGDSATDAQESVADIEKARELQKFLRLVDLLDRLAEANQYEVLSPALNEPSLHHKSKRLTKVEEFVMKNYFESISVKDAAEIAGMNKSSFCRFFKQATSQTFSEYLNEIRIGYACKLLAGSRRSITEVCFDCGYNNLSHFNRTFKKIVGRIPSDYRKASLSKNQTPSV